MALGAANAVTPAAHRAAPIGRLAPALAVAPSPRALSGVAPRVLDKEPFPLVRGLLEHRRGFLLGGAHLREDAGTGRWRLLQVPGHKEEGKGVKFWGGEVAAALLDVLDGAAQRQRRGRRVGVRALTGGA